MFWGNATLSSRLSSLIKPFDPNRIERASYRLSIGEEVYVSPTGEPNDRHGKPITSLSPKKGFAIPPGQFGFILTKESVSVPKDAIALISIRASYKFQGLVNVSGFHVDPGYRGRLIFSVFNSGPNAVHLRQGEECFLIWYAGLDMPSTEPWRDGHCEIPSTMSGPLAQGVESLSRLRTDIETLKRTTDFIRAIGGSLIGVTILIVALIGLFAPKGALGSPLVIPPPIFGGLWFP